MFESLLDQSFYEFPSFKVALFSLLLAFVLSTVIAFTYKLTYRGITYSPNFFQAMVLSSVAASMVIMAVGNNIAVGFGIIGAIAIIRFRTTVNEPRNIIFIFASLGVGIATGVYGYSIAVSGTLIYCAVAFILHFSAGSRTEVFLYALTFNISTPEAMASLLTLLDIYCDSHHLMSVGDGKMEDERYEYQITLKQEVDHKDIYQNLSKVEGLRNVKLSRKTNSERL